MHHLLKVSTPHCTYALCFEQGMYQDFEDFLSETLALLVTLDTSVNHASIRMQRIDTITTQGTHASVTQGASASVSIPALSNHVSVVEEHVTPDPDATHDDRDAVEQYEYIIAHSRSLCCCFNSSKVNVSI